MPSAPLIILGNGRTSCVARTVDSIRAHLSGFGPVTVVDDSGDENHRAWLRETVAPILDASVVPVASGRAGYPAAMQRVWALARAHESVAFWEEDFVLTEDVDLSELAAVLTDRPYLTQMALIRQPWFGNEIAHGGMIEALEAQGQHFTEVSDAHGHDWIEHRAVFTGNPSLIPARTLAHDWPSGDWSESRFGRALFGSDPRLRGAYWGRRSDLPRVEHIGHQRVGAGY